jgi:hypothetical protein
MGSTLPTVYTLRGKRKKKKEKEKGNLLTKYYKKKFKNSNS